MTRHPFLDATATQHDLVGRRVKYYGTLATIVGVQRNGSLCIETDAERAEREDQPNPHTSAGMTVVSPDNIEFVD